MFTTNRTQPADDAPGSIASTFAAMLRAMEQNPEWQARQNVQAPMPQRIGRLTCAERTAIAKKAAAARWARRT
jgi:hypothetical protein